MVERPGAVPSARTAPAGQGLAAGLQVQDVVWMECSQEELLYVAGLLGAHAIVGVRDPFSGIASDQVESVMTRAQRGLASRGLLGFDESGRRQLDAGLASLVGLVAYPSTVISLAVDGTSSTGDGNTAESDGSGRAPTLYLREDMAAELTPAAGGYRLAGIVGVDRLVERLMASLGVNAQPAAPGQRVVLPEDWFAAVRSLARVNGAAHAQAVLAQADIDADSARVLARTLAMPDRAGAVSIVRLQESSADAEPATLEATPAGSFAFLSGPEGLWRVLPFIAETRDQPPVRESEAARDVMREQEYAQAQEQGEALRYLEITPCDAGELADGLRRWLGYFEEQDRGNAD